jgi:hypothetical protein
MALLDGCSTCCSTWHTDSGYGPGLYILAAFAAVSSLLIVLSSSFLIPMQLPAGSGKPPRSGGKEAKSRRGRSREGRRLRMLFEKVTDECHEVKIEPKSDSFVLTEVETKSQVNTVAVAMSVDPVAVAEVSAVAMSEETIKKDSAADDDSIYESDGGEDNFDSLAEVDGFVSGGS